MTLNNYSEVEFEALKAIECRYKVIGKEVGANGTPHLQCYFYWDQQIAFSTVKTLVNRGHIEKSRGTPQENRKYCTKDGDFLELGALPTPGKRNDLKDAANLVKTHGLKRVAEDMPETFIRYSKGLKDYRLALQSKRNFETKVVVLSGVTGIGKSRLALEFCEYLNCDVYYKPRGGWWDDYNQERCVIIDDFYGWIKYDEMLRICDRYPHKVEIKGGYVQFLSHLVVITSNKPLAEWYSFSTASLARRVTRMYQLDTPEQAHDARVQLFGDDELAAAVRPIKRESEIIELSDDDATGSTDRLLTSSPPLGGRGGKQRATQLPASECDDSA